jgi:hypothetical protein
MGYDRHASRAVAKAAYRKFSEQWRKERAYQRWLLDGGKELPEGTPRLGRKPTFAQWAKIAKTEEAKQTATPAEVQEFKDEDLEWEEQEDKA